MERTGDGRLRPFLRAGVHEGAAGGFLGEGLAAGCLCADSHLGSGGQVPSDPGERTGETALHGAERGEGGVASAVCEVAGVIAEEGVFVAAASAGLA